MMKKENILKLFLIGTPMVLLFVIIGNMIFWSLAMGKADAHTMTSKEISFFENFKKSTGLYITYFYPHKGEKIHYISIERGGIDSPNVRLNKNNIRVFSDSVYSELMKVYSLKSDTDSIVIKINIDGSKNHIHKIDTTFSYRVK
ncbi:hypothetical protein ACFFUE_05625 [Bergeyella porcorum]|uniref:hypothetical protein n=1 Tax=Bergeyella porcorum TaxID=1735111 RepID=UPI0035EC218A